MDITVIIPVYNTAPWLSECIDSVLAVPSLELEIILVDDESMDNSRDIMQAYAAKHSNITALLQTHGRQGKARNTGLARASGKYVLFLDSDDRLHKKTLVDFYNEAEIHQPDFVVGIAQSFRGWRRWINPGSAIYDKAAACTTIDAFPDLLHDSSVCNKLYRREFLVQNNLLFPENTYCEDVYFCFKSYLLAKKITILPKIIHEYRGRGAGCAPSGTQTFSIDRLIQCASIYHSCINEYRKEKNRIINKTLDDRIVLKFARSFQRMKGYPDGDAIFYKEIQNLFSQLNVISILENSGDFAIPFFMIRKGFFRHALAVLHDRKNALAIEDFTTFLRNDDIKTHDLLKNHIKKKNSTINQKNNHAVSLFNIRNRKKKLCFLSENIASTVYNCTKKHVFFIKIFLAKKSKFLKRDKYVLPGYAVSHAKRTIFLFLLLFLRTVLRLATKKRLWLISERRGMSIEENGYIFFKYCLNTTKATTTYYILNKGVPLPSDCSHDFSRIVRKYSWKYIYALALADVLIFTNSSEDIFPCGVPKWLSSFISTVYLTHGGNLYGAGPFLRKKANYFSKIIAVSDRHKSIMVKAWAIRDPGKIVVTGLPRYDELHGRQPDNEILFCLTWRKRLDGLRPEKFLDSQYCRAIHSILQEPRLLHLLTVSDMRLRLRFHFRMKNHGDVFDQYKSERVLVEYSDSIVPLRKVLQKAAVLVTDYSSIMWDMAYMQRPVILYQFDADAFLAERGLHGFNTKEKDMEFAHVVKSHEEFMNALEKLNRNKFVLNESQKRNAWSFFQFHDAKNCERVFDMIDEIDA